LADLIFPKSAFRKVCIEIANDIVRDLQHHLPSSTYANIGSSAIGWSGRFSQESLIAWQMSAEKYLMDYFYIAYLLQIETSLIQGNNAVFIANVSLSTGRKYS
jgi:fucose permease